MIKGRHNYLIAIGYLILVLGLLILPWVIELYDLHIIIIAYIYIILALSLNLMVGYVGELPLCQAAFFGIGAYASALLSVKLGIPFWPCLLAAFVISGFVGFLIGFITLRLKGHYFVLISLAFAEIIHILAINLEKFTGGLSGIKSIPSPVLPIPFFGNLIFDSELSFYYLVLIFMLFAIYFMVRLVNSLLGKTFVAIRENNDLAEAVGINIFKYKLTAFIMATAFSGLAGSLYAHYVALISPTILGFDYTMTPLVMVAIGGQGTISGPIIGALIFTALPEYFRIVSKYRLVLLGFVLVVTIVFLPRGITSFLSKIYRILKKRWATDEAIT
jgi:branched-chain amino acid transport system permease protein